MSICASFKGTSDTLVGATMLDMEHLLKVNTEQITLVISVSRIGCILGTFISTILYKRINIDLQMALLILLRGLSELTAPLASSYPYYFMMMTVSYFARGYIETGLSHNNTDIIVISYNSIIFARYPL